jgi:putative ABC transport system ATP-binding protein
MSNNGHHFNRSAAEAPILRAENVSKLYTDGQVSALVDVSLEIYQGEYVSIMGHSGSGKSTLLNMLGMLDRPTSGEVFLDGQPVSQVRNLDSLRAEKIGFVFQSFYLLPVLSAMENVQVPMFESNRDMAERPRKARELLELVKLGHRVNHLPLQLSVGERQRVAIARALANDPLLLLADEPTGNLDSKSADSVFDLFAQLHRERGMTIVLITHSDDLGVRADRILRMEDGCLVSDTRSPGRSARQAPGGNGSEGDLGQGDSGPSGWGLGLVRPPRPKSILPPFAIPDHG